jgi:isopenicillin N synthase-like dioxygenase
MSYGAKSLPVLDISPFLADESSPGAQKVIKELLDICTTIGFVYIVGHGIPPAVDAAVLRHTREFFDLDDADRLAIVNTQSPYFRGYTRLGMERTAGAADWRDQIDIGPENPPSHPGPHDPIWLRLRGPNQWPPALPALRPAVADWMARMEALSRAVLRALALGLGQPADHFEYAVHPGPEVLVKLMRYPSLPGGGQGVGPHLDAGLLSFILQDTVGGLEVLPDGAPPVPAPPTPGAYVMNLGEMLQLATRGALRATLHRVASPPHPGPQRVSAAYFFNPRMEAVVRPVPLPPGRAAAPRAGAAADPGDPIFATYGLNWLKSRLRSHPDVAAIHHPDLVAAMPDLARARAPGPHAPGPG